MITINTYNGEHVEKTYDLVGLSTDEKPTDEKIVNGSTFYEMDTKSAFIYDEQNHIWWSL